MLFLFVLTALLFSTEVDLIIGGPLTNRSRARGKLFLSLRSTMVRTARQPTFRIDVPSSSPAPSSASPAQRSSNLQTQIQTRLTELEEQLPTLHRSPVASTVVNATTNGAPESSPAGQTQGAEGQTQAVQGQTQAVERLARCVRSLAGVMLALLREVDGEGNVAEEEVVPREAWVVWRERCRRALVEGQGIIEPEVEPEVEAEVEGCTET